MVLQYHHKECLKLPVTKHRNTNGSQMLLRYIFIDKSIHLIQ